MAQNENESITLDINFKLTDLSFSTVSVNGTAYSELNYGNLSNSADNIGDPLLPRKVVRLYVPTYAKDFDVKISAKGKISNMVLPDPILLQKEESTTSSYNQNLQLPTIPFTTTAPFSPQIISDDFVNGNQHVVTISFCPLQYDEKTSSIQLPSQFNLTLSYKVCDASEMSIQPITPGRAKPLSTIFKDVSNAPQLVSKLNTDNDDTEITEYFIITSEYLKESFNGLADWKRQKGYNVHVITMDSVYKSEYAAQGDLISRLNDDAGKLRAFIRHIFEIYGQTFILLGGDYKHVPIRYAGGASNPYPCDWYFAELNSNWDYNRDGITGDKIYHIGSEAEMIIGRLCCFKPEHAINYTKKLIQYELNPGDGDASYLNNYFSFIADRFDDYASRMSKRLNLSPTVIYGDTINYPRGNQLISAMKEGYGFFDLNGHGTPQGISSVKRYIHGQNMDYGICAETDKGAPGITTHEFDNGLDKLDNARYPAIAYSTSCHVAPFDRFDSVAVQFSQIRKPGENLSIANSFTCGEGYGGPAFIGNTRHGYLSVSEKLDTVFVEMLSQNNCIGIAHTLSKTLYRIRRGTPYISLVNHLVGEPEFKVWLGAPNRIVANCNYNGENVSLTCNDMDGARLILFDGANHTSTIIDNQKSIVLPSSSFQIISLWKDRSLPCILLHAMDEISNKKMGRFVVEDAFLSYLGKSPQIERSLKIINSSFSVDAIKNIRSGETIISQGSIISMQSRYEFYAIKLVIENNSKVDITGSDISIQNLSLSKDSDLTLIQQ